MCVKVVKLISPEKQTSCYPVQVSTIFAGRTFSGVQLLTNECKPPDKRMNVSHLTKQKCSTSTYKTHYIHTGTFFWGGERESFSLTLKVIIVISKSHSNSYLHFWNHTRSHKYNNLITLELAKKLNESQCDIRYSIMNHAWIEKAMSEAVQHSKICPGKLSVGKESTPKHVSGSFYSSYELVCSEGCGKKMHVETDVCNEKPDPDLNCNDTTANDSAITKVF